jgi:anti-anti-sigma factor
VPAPEFLCTIDVDGDETVVHPVGEIDLETSASLRQALAPLHGRVVVDLGEVSFIDSSGMSVFAVTRKRLAGDGGTLTLRAPRPHVRRVLEITGLDVWLDTRS